MQINPFALPLLGIALANGALAVYIRWRSRTVGASILVVLLAGATIMSTAYALELMSPQLSDKLWWAAWYYLGGHITIISTLLFALWYTGHQRWLTWRRTALLAAVPAFFLVVYWTNGWHHLHYTAVRLDIQGPVPMRAASHGPFYWLQMVQVNLYTLAAIYLLAQRLPDRHSVHRAQLTVVICGALAPAAANVAYLVGIRPFGILNLTPFSFTFTALAMAWAVMRLQMLDLRPVARELVVQKIPVGVLVLDAWQHVVEINPAAEDALNVRADQAMGRGLDHAGAHFATIAALAAHPEANLSGEYTSVRAGRVCHFVVEVRSLDDFRPPRENFTSAGCVVLLHDVTDQREVEQERLEQQRAAAAHDEREKMARQLHDGVGQVVGYLNTQAQAVREYLASGQTAMADATAARMAEVAQDAHADIRDFILGVQVDRSTARGFLPALERYVEQFTTQYGLPVRLDLPDCEPEIRLEPEAETQALSIIKEALTNVRKHSGARQAEIALVSWPDGLQVTISDDGCGFDPATVDSTTGHFGSHLMRERAVEAGGLLQIRSQPGAGTQVSLELSCRRPAPPGVLADLRVLLVDDQPLFRNGLRNLLAARSITVVGEAGNGREAIEMARRLQPNLILLDVAMPEMDGLSALRQIKAEQPETKVVMLTVAGTRDNLVEAMQSGASGYLLKDLDATEFFRLLEQLARGESLVSSSMASCVLQEITAAAARTPPASATPAPTGADLTPRQKEILVLIARGLPYKTIAQQLYLSEATIKYHVARILETLGVDKRDAAVVVARQRGWLDEPPAPTT